MASLSHASKRGIFKCREKTKLASKTCVTASPDVQNSSRQLQPTTNMHAQPLSTPWSRSKLSLPKLKASLVACFRHLLAENFFPRFRKLRRSQKTSVANQNGQQPTKYFSAQRKLPRTVENFENSLAPEDILIAQHLQLRCSHFHTARHWERPSLPRRRARSPAIALRSSALRRSSRRQTWRTMSRRRKILIMFVSTSTEVAEGLMLKLDEDAFWRRYGDEAALSAIAVLLDKRPPQKKRVIYNASYEVMSGVSTRFARLELGKSAVLRSRSRKTSPRHTGIILPLSQ